MGSDLTPWILVLIGALGLGALAAYIKMTPADRIPTEQLRQDRLAQTPATTHVETLRPRYEQGNLKFTKKTVEVRKGEDAIVVAVNAYLAEAKVAPEDAALVSVEIKDGVADLYFNGAFNTTYGTEDEQTILTGILSVLGQFPSIEAVRFFSEGKPISTLGNVDLTDPQPVIRSAESSTEKP
jgi:hypothetical protein